MLCSRNVVIVVKEGERSVLGTQPCPGKEIRKYADLGVRRTQT